jgi:hypothetical protein
LLGSQDHLDEGCEPEVANLGGNNQAAQFRGRKDPRIQCFNDEGSCLAEEERGIDTSHQLGLDPLDKDEGLEMVHLVGINFRRWWRRGRSRSRERRSSRGRTLKI